MALERSPTREQCPYACKHWTPCARRANTPPLGPARLRSQPCPQPLPTVPPTAPNRAPNPAPRHGIPGQYVLQLELQVLLRADGPHTCPPPCAVEAPAPNILFRVKWRNPSHTSTRLGGNVCPARTGPLEGPNFPPEDRDLPCPASWGVEIAIRGTELRQTGQVSGPTTRIQPLRWSRARRADVP